MRIAIVMTVLFLMLFSCNFLRKSVKVNQGGAEVSAYQDTLPIEYVKDKIILPVRINGKIRRFIFDTGAITVISESLFREMDYAVMGEDHFYDIHKNRDTSLLVRTGVMHLGDITFNQVPAIVYDLKSLPWSCFQVDGIIGSNMLRDAAVRVDLRDSLFILAHDARKLSNNMQEAREMRLDRQSSPHVHVRFDDNHEGFFLFDSGREGFINIGREEFYIMKERISLELKRQGYGSEQMGMIGPGENNRVYRIELDSILISGQKIHNPHLEVTPNVSSIGSQLFQYGKVTLDYKDKRFRLDPYRKPMEYQMPQSRGFGFSPVIKQDTFRVGLVWKNSLVDSLGLEPGNPIRRINQYNYADSLEQAFCKSFLNNVLKDSETLEIIYQDQEGDYKRVKLRRKD